MKSVKAVNPNHAWWVAVFVVLLLVSSVAPVLADSPSESASASSQSEEKKPEPPPLPNSQEVREAVESEGTTFVEPAPTNPQAAEGVPHEDLGRDEALALLDGVFGAVLDAPAGIFDELHVEKFLAPDVAVIAAGEQPEGPTPATEEPSDHYEGPTLLDSTVPLRAEAASGKEEAVDLSLEHAEGQIQSSNPIVEVGIPAELGEGIDLPESGVRIELAGAPAERSPSIIDKSVAGYVNVAEDTDFAIAPTPTGVETLTQLRSAQSPHTQAYNLKLPAGATLQASKDGGAEVIREGDELLRVLPPSAIDATGAAVPVTLEVSGDSLTLTVSPEEATKFPILLDPLFQNYKWQEKKTTGGIFNSSSHEEWSPETFKKAGGFPTPYRAVSPQEWGWNGLVAATGSGPASSGDHAAWIYTVPRYFTDKERPTSFISHMSVSNLIWAANSGTWSPYTIVGLWDPNSGWVESYSHDGLTGHTVNEPNFIYQFVNPTNENVKLASVGIWALENLSSPGANSVEVGTAAIELAEGAKDVPGISVAAPSEWVNQTAAPIGFTASDSGLGVYAITVAEEKANPQSWKTPYGCVGVGDSACPHTWKSPESGQPALKYDPSVLPQGINYLKVNAEDPLGHISESVSAQVKVDHTAPDLALSGTLTEQGILGNKWPTYKLKLKAIDGSEVSPQSGVTKTVVEVDGKIVDQTTPGCSTENCAVSREWTLEAGQYSSGAHTVKVTATDAVGLTTTKTLSIGLQAASPPSVALSGAMTEQGTLGTSRPRYKLKVNASALTGGGAVPVNTPTFSSSFGTAGTGNGQFAHPAGIAVDPKGNIWVVDENHYRVQKFNEAGAYLSSFGSQGAENGKFARPTDVAIDAKGNIWVTDAGNNRIEEFNEKGEFVIKIGAGSGALNGPESIAIDSKGNIWVGDTYNGRLQEFNENGVFVRTVGSKGPAAGQIGQSTGVAVGPGGNIWVADWEYNRVIAYSETGTFIRQFGLEGTGNGQFKHPDVIDVDSGGNVWVGDQSNSRVQEFTQNGEYVTQFGTAGSGTGQFSFGWPMGIATDSKGNIWVADTGNNRVQRWQVPYVPTYISSFGSYGSPVGQFNHPGDIAIDAKGNLWVVDKANNRIQEFTESGGGPLGAFGSLGSTGGKLNSPSGIVVDPSGNVWVTDTGNTRVVEFNGKGEFVATFGTNVNKTKVESGGTQSKRNLCTEASKNVCQAGTTGSLGGQMKEPMGIAASGGNLFIESSLVISELPPGAGAWRWTFPARNRIIAGISGMTVVVEAAQRSGSLITADFATAFGRELGAVPGPVTARNSAGVNDLLAGGAQLVRHATDVFDVMSGGKSPGEGSSPTG